MSAIDKIRESDKSLKAALLCKECGRAVVRGHVVTVEGDEGCFVLHKKCARKLEDAGLIHKVMP